MPAKRLLADKTYKDQRSKRLQVGNAILRSDAHRLESSEYVDFLAGCAQSLELPLIEDEARLRYEQQRGIVFLAMSLAFGSPMYFGSLFVPDSSWATAHFSLDVAFLVLWFSLRRFATWEVVQPSPDLAPQSTNTYCNIYSLSKVVDVLGFRNSILLVPWLHCGAFRAAVAPFGQLHFHIHNCKLLSLLGAFCKQPLLPLSSLSPELLRCLDVEAARFGVDPAPVKSQVPLGQPVVVLGDLRGLTGKHDW